MWEPWPEGTEFFGYPPLDSESSRGMYNGVAAWFILIKKLKWKYILLKMKFIFTFPQ